MKAPRIGRAFSQARQFPTRKSHGQSSPHRSLRRRTHRHPARFPRPSRNRLRGTPHLGHCRGKAERNGASRRIAGSARTGVVGVLKGRGDGGRRIGLRPTWTRCRWRKRPTCPGVRPSPTASMAAGTTATPTILLGAARYLAETRDFDGTAVFIFQPAEEGLGGARAMIGDGLFEQFPCDEIYGLHNAPDLAPNQVASFGGPGHGGGGFLRHRDPRPRQPWRDAQLRAGPDRHRDGDRPGLADHRQSQRQSARSGGGVDHANALGLGL